MDSDLYESLKKIKIIFKLFYPDVQWTGELIPTRIVQNKPKKIVADDEIAIFFSGGLDSVCTSFSHLDKKQLLISIHGRFDLPISNQHLWNNIKTKCEDFARNYGQKITCASSNFYGFINVKNLNNLSYPTRKWWVATGQALPFAGIAAPILVSKGQKHIFLASSYTKDCSRPKGTHPLLDNNISFAGVSLHHDGQNLSRVEKCAVLSSVSKRLGLVHPQIWICPKDANGENCCKCEKCLCTINCILATGNNHRKFGFPIDLDNAMSATQEFLSVAKYFKYYYWRCIQDIKGLWKMKIHKLFIVPK